MKSLLSCFRKPEVVNEPPKSENLRKSIDKYVDDFKKDMNDNIHSLYSNIVEEVKLAVCHEKQQADEFAELHKKINELEIQKNNIEQQFILLVTGNSSGDHRLSVDNGRVVTTTA